jgi:hypothetical protein
MGLRKWVLLRTSLCRVRWRCVEVAEKAGAMLSSSPTRSDSKILMLLLYDRQTRLA